MFRVREFSVCAIMRSLGRLEIIGAQSPWELIALKNVWLLNLL